MEGNIDTPLSASCDDEPSRKCLTPRIDALQRTKKEIPPHSPTTCEKLVTGLRTELDQCLQFRINEGTPTEEHETEGQGALTRLEDALSIIKTLKYENSKLEEELNVQSNLLSSTKRDSELRFFRLTKDLEKKNLEIVQLKDLKDELTSREALLESRYERRIEAFGQSVPQTNITSPESIPEETDLEEKVESLETEIEGLHERLRLLEDDKGNLVEQLNAATVNLTIQSHKAEQYASLTNDLISDFQELSTTISTLRDDFMKWQNTLHIDDSVEQPLTLNDEMDKLLTLVKCGTPSFEFNSQPWSISDDFTLFMSDFMASFKPIKNEVDALLSFLEADAIHMVQTSNEMDCSSNDLYSYVMALLAANNEIVSPAVLTRDSDLELNTLRNELACVQVENFNMKSEVESLTNEKDRLSQEIQSMINNAGLLEDSLQKKCEDLEKLARELDLLKMDKESLIDQPLGIKMSESMVDVQVSLLETCDEPANQTIEAPAVKRERLTDDTSGMTSYMSANSSLLDQSMLGVNIKNICTVSRSDDLQEFAEQFSEYLKVNEVFHPDDVPPTDSSVFHFLLDRYLDIVHAYNRAREDILALEGHDDTTKMLLTHLNSQLQDDSNITNSTDGDLVSSFCDIKHENISFSNTLVDEMTHDPLQITVDGMLTPSIRRVKMEPVTPAQNVLRIEPVSSVKKTVTFRSPLLSQRINLDAENNQLKKLINEKTEDCLNLEKTVESQKYEISRIKERIDELNVANANYLEELAQLGQEYTAKNEELQNKFQDSMDQNLKVREHLLCEIIDLDPSLKEQLQVVPLTEVMEKFMTLIMTRCKDLQNVEKAGYDKIKEEWECEKLRLTTNIQDVKENLRQLNFEKDNVTALLSHANQEKSSLEHRVTVLEDEIVKLKRNKCDTDAHVNQVKKQFESEVKTLKEEIGKKDAEVRNCLSNIGKLEIDKENNIKLLETMKIQLEEALSGKIALEEQQEAFENICAEKLASAENECQSIISEKVALTSHLTEEVASLRTIERDLTCKLNNTQSECASLKIQVADAFLKIDTLRNKLDVNSESAIAYREKEDDLSSDNEKLRLELVTMKSCIQALKEKELKSNEEVLSLQSALSALVCAKDVECQRLEDEVANLKISLTESQHQLQAAQEEHISLLAYKNNALEMQMAMHQLKEEEESLKIAFTMKNTALQKEYDELLGAHERALQQLIPEYEALESEAIKLYDAIFGEDRDKTRNIEDAVSRIHAMLKVKKKSVLEIEGLRRDIQTAEEQNKELEHKLSQVNERITSLEDEHVILKENNLKLEADAKTLKEVNLNLQSSLNEKGQIDELVGEKDILLENLKAEKDELMLKLAELAQEKLEVTESVSKLKTELLEYEEVVAQKLACDRELEVLRQENSNLKYNFEERIKDKSAQKDSLQKEIDNLTIKNKQLEGDFAAVLKEKQDLVVALGEKGEFDVLMKETDALIEKLLIEKEELHQLFSIATKEKLDADNIVRRLATEVANHEKCLTLLEEEIVALKEERNLLKGELCSVEGKVSAQLEKDEALCNLNVQVEEQRKIIADSAEELEGLKIKLSDSLSKISTLERELFVTQEERDEFKLLQDIYDGDLAALRSEKEQLELCMKEVGDQLAASEKLLINAETRNAAFAAELDLVKSELSSNKSVIEALTKEVDEVMSSRNSFKTISENLRKELEDAARYKEELRLAESEIISKKLTIDKLTQELHGLMLSSDLLKSSTETLQAELKEVKFELEGYKSTEVAILKKLEEKQMSNELNAKLASEITDLQLLLTAANGEEEVLRSQISHLRDEVGALMSDVEDKQRLLNSAQSKLLVISKTNSNLEDSVKKLTVENEELQRVLKEQDETSDGAKHRMNDLNRCLETFQMKISQQEVENHQSREQIYQKDGTIMDLNVRVKELEVDKDEMVQLLTDIQNALQLPKEALLSLKKREDVKSYLRFIKDQNEKNSNTLLDLREENKVIMGQKDRLLLEVENLRKEKVEIELKTEELRAFGKNQEVQIEGLHKKLTGIGRPRRSDIGARRMDKLEEINEALNGLFMQVLKAMGMPNVQEINLLTVYAIDRASKAILSYAKEVGQSQKTAEEMRGRMEELDLENQELSDNVEGLLQNVNKLELELLALTEENATNRECSSCTKLKAALEDLKLVSAQQRGEVVELNKKLSDLENCCKKLRLDLEEKGEELVRTACSSTRSNEMRLRGTDGTGMAREVDQDHVRQLTKKCDMYKELLRSRSKIIKELEAKLATTKSPIISNSNSMDSPIREQCYNMRTRGDVAAAYKRAVRQKAFGIENL